MLLVENNIDYIPDAMAVFKKNHFDDIPNELVADIGSFLDANSLLSFCLTSKNMNFILKRMLKKLKREWKNSQWIPRKLAIDEYMIRNNEIIDSGATIWRKSRPHGKPAIFVQRLEMEAISIKKFGSFEEYKQMKKERKIKREERSIKKRKREEKEQLRLQIEYENSAQYHRDMIAKIRKREEKREESRKFMTKLIENRFLYVHTKYKQHRDSMLSRGISECQAEDMAKISAIGEWSENNKSRYTFEELSSMLPTIKLQQNLRYVYTTNGLIRKYC